MIILGITGTIGAGKGVTVEYLKKKGFVHYSVRGYLVEELDRRGSEKQRDHMVWLANELREKYGPSHIMQELHKKAVKGKKNGIIESIRAKGEAEFLKAQKNFFLISVDAPLKERYKRILKRGSITDNISFKQFVSEEKREMYSKNPTKGNIEECMNMADFHLRNNGSLKDLHKQIEEVIKSLGVINKNIVKSLAIRQSSCFGR